MCVASHFLRQAGITRRGLEDVHKGEHALPAIVDLNWWEKDIKIQLAEKRKSQFQTLEQLCDFLPIYSHIFLSKFISARNYWKNICENEAFSGISQVSEETVKNNELSFKLTSCFYLWILGMRGFSLFGNNWKQNQIILLVHLAYSKGNYIFWPILRGLFQVCLIVYSFQKKKEIMWSSWSWFCNFAHFILILVL